MPRVVSLFLPFFPTDRLRRSAARARPDGGALSPERSDRPLVTVARDGQRRVLAAVDAAAASLGLRPGQPVAQATAGVPDLVLAEAAPAADAQALRDLAAWCLRYAPVVQPDAPDGIFLDVDGAAHLAGGEAALLADLLRRLGRAGLAARAALADTPGAAWALARYGAASPLLLPPGEGEGALAPLPVAALRIDGDTAGRLGLLGVARIGDLARLPRPQLALRFGGGVGAALDRALGRAPEPLTPLVPRNAAVARCAFAEPLGDGEGLARAVAALLPDLCRILERRGEGLRRLDTLVRRVDGRPIGLRIGTATPTRDPAHLGRLLGARLPEIDPGFGIDEVVVAATRTERTGPVQADARRLLDPDGTFDDPAALGPLVDRLGVRFGAARVYRAAPVESRRPERSVRRVAPLAPATGASWPPGLPRPPRLIDPPERVRAVAVVPDHAPTFFTWRRVRFVVRHADGPERVRGEWWRADDELLTLRDYYRIEDKEGRRFWLFRDAPMGEGASWWMHGRFA